MSELLKPPAVSEIVMPSAEEMLYLTAVCLANSIHTNLGRTVDHHVNHFTHKPNILNNIDLLEAGDVATTTGYIYRKLGFKAIEDLIEYGIVRNELTARANTPRSGGNSVFWVPGRDGRYMNTEGQIIIETKAEELLKGWVTKNKLTAIYAPTPNGNTESLALAD